MVWGDLKTGRRKLGMNGCLMRSRFLFIGVLVALFLAVVPVVLPGLSLRGAEAGTISNFSVNGNVRVESETVLSYLPINPGDNVDDELIDEAIKALFQTGLFKDVDMEERGSTLVITVVENPLINVVNFEGNDAIDDEALAKEVQVRERMIFTKSRVAGDTRRILDLYAKQGYYNVSVVPKLIRLEENRVNLAFEINEGIKTRVRSVIFEGNEAFSDGRLRDVVNTKQYSWYRYFARNTTYDADRLEFDKEFLRRFYLKHGYADAEVVSADAQLSSDGDGFIIIFTVTEGPRYSIADVAINVGDSNLDPVPLQRAVKTAPGDTYNAERADKSAEKLTIEAARQGFVFAKVEPKVDRSPGNGTLNLTYEISEGPRTYIERIDIVGNDRTLDHVIRRELLLFEGDAYNKALVERARRRLTQLDFFQSIEFKEEQGSAPDKIVLVLEVVEKSTGNITFSIGYSSVETVVGSVSLSERNLFGRGYQASINTRVSFKKQALDLSFTDPYFLDMPIAAGFDIFANRSDLVASSSYKSEQLGFALRTGFKLNDETSMTLKYLFAHRNVNGINPAKASPEVIRQEGTSIKSALSASLVYDGLDDPIKPLFGFRGQIQAEVAGLGGDARYGALEASAWYFYSVLDDQVTFKLEGNVGHIQPFGNDVSIEDRFFKGGNTFRGFAAAGIGPKQLGNDGKYDSIGAQTYAIGTVEALFRLPFVPEALGIQGVAFSDFGTVFNSGVEDEARTTTSLCNGGTSTVACTVSDAASLRASVGGGILWDSPFGPLRFELSYPLLKDDTDTVERFQFSIGSRF